MNKLIKLTEEDQDILDDYPKHYVTQEEFDSLPEYTVERPPHRAKDMSISVKKWKVSIEVNENDLIWLIGRAEGTSMIFYQGVLDDHPELIPGNDDYYMCSAFKIKKGDTVALVSTDGKRRYDKSKYEIIEYKPNGDNVGTFKLVGGVEPEFTIELSEVDIISLDSVFVPDMIIEPEKS